MTTDAFADLASFTALRRLTGLALSLDGTRLVASVQQPDAKGARYISSLWEIPFDGGEPARLTRSEKGEKSPAFLPDGTLLFTSARPDPDGGPDQEDDAGEDRLWALPPHGEPKVLARRGGGLGTPVVAAGSGAVVLGGSRLAFSTAEDDDRARRTTRKDRKISAILHTGMPIRFWDHELGQEAPDLVHLADPAVGALNDLTPEATTEMIEASYSISADGATVATTWRPRRSRGRCPYAVSLIDVASGKRTVLAAADGWQFGMPLISPDGAQVAMERERDGTFELALTSRLALFPAAGGERVVADLGDLWPTEWAWSSDASTLFVAGDLHGRGAVVAVEPATGKIRSRLATDAVYASLCPSPDGQYLYALRSTIAEPMTPVRLDTAATDQSALVLPTPAAVPELPGRLEEVQVEVDGATVRGWLCLPADGDTPAPLMQWIHGGPFTSYNAWSWRWSPWVAVKRGWAVLLPDPALSTGYGDGWIERAWPHEAQVVWRDVEALLDAVVARPDIDSDRTAVLGASFGGYMTNWIAGHTDRFKAIVTHAGLWALDQQHKTTDAAQFKTGIFGEPAEHPEWYARNSPNNSAANIVTPMLVVHGSRDYRVPISEALRMWWDLVSGWSGEPDDLPHRFLQLTGENHWVTSPANSEIWYDAVLGFCAEHVLGEPWTPSPLL